jgi:hypothetical protein
MTQGGLVAPLLTASLNNFGSKIATAVDAKHYVKALETNRNHYL